MSQKGMISSLRVVGESIGVRSTEYRHRYHSATETLTRLYYQDWLSPRMPAMTSNPANGPSLFSN